MAKKNKSFHDLTVAERIKITSDEGFERRMKVGIKELNQSVEMNPTYGDRIDTHLAFYPMLEEMRKHFTPKEIREFVEIHFQLENISDSVFNIIREMEPLIKNYLEQEQSFYIKKVKDGLEEALEPFDDVEMVAVAKDSVELGYLATDLYQGIEDILEEFV